MYKYLFSIEQYTEKSCKKIQIKIYNKMSDLDITIYKIKCKFKKIISVIASSINTQPI